MNVLELVNGSLGEPLGCTCCENASGSFFCAVGPQAYDALPAAIGRDFPPGTALAAVYCDDEKFMSVKRILSRSGYRVFPLKTKGNTAAEAQTIKLPEYVRAAVAVDCADTVKYYSAMTGLPVYCALSEPSATAFLPSAVLDSNGLRVFRTPSPAAVFPPADIRKAIEDIRTQLAAAGLGIELVEINGGYRFQTAALCGPWVRQMLNKGRATVLSRPSIETLAIIAYRQPVTRSEIESVRGVNAGHVIKALMEMQLVRIVGRSDLPGRPFLFGTTPQFLEHFGLKSLSDLETLPGAPGDGAAAATPLPQPPVLSTAR